MMVKHENDRWESRRISMVGTLRAYGISDEQILKVMGTVPRHLFIPEEYRNNCDSYGDHPCPIGFKQTISQPYVVAYMTGKMNIKPDEKILEIGTGSGYQAAVLSMLQAEIYSVEIIPQLAAHAKQVLNETGYLNVNLLSGDGYLGWPEHNPYDVIIVTCAPDVIPEPLVDQLKEGGRMILPLGNLNQRLVILRKKSGQLHKVDDLHVRFVPMIHSFK